MINVGMWIHSQMRDQHKRGVNSEMVHYDTMMLVYW